MNVRVRERNGRPDQGDTENVLWASHFVQHLSDGFKRCAVAPVESDKAWVIVRKLSKRFGNSGAESSKIGGLGALRYDDRTGQTVCGLRQSAGKANGVLFPFTT